MLGGPLLGRFRTLLMRLRFIGPTLTCSRAAPISLCQTPTSVAGGGRWRWEEGGGRREDGGGMEEWRRNGGMEEEGGRREEGGKRGKE